MVPLIFHSPNLGADIILYSIIICAYSFRSVAQSPVSKIDGLFTTQQVLQSNGDQYVERLSFVDYRFQSSSSSQSTSKLDRHKNLTTGLLGQISSNITFNAKLDKLLRLVDQDTILKNLQILSNGGEDPNDDNRWITRHSYSQGAFKAVNWLKNQYEKLSHGGDTRNPIKCEFDYYLVGVAPNLICKMVWSFNDSINHHNTYDGHGISENVAIDLDDRGNQDAEDDQDLLPEDYSIVLTAHYDSKGSFGSIEAPGADDNASGCSALLSIAQLIQEHQNEIIKLKENHLDLLKLNSEGTSLKKNQFKNKFEIVFINFSGTEQGLLGSESISKKIGQDLVGAGKDSKKLVMLLVNVNMISYRALYEPRQMGLSNLGCSAESFEFMKRISNTYVPELVVGNTSIGLSDEVNFQSNGIPNSIRIFESLGNSIKNPNYLKSSDEFSNFLDHSNLNKQEVDHSESDGFYDIIQVALIAKVLLASVLELLFY